MWKRQRLERLVFPQLCQLLENIDYFSRTRHNLEQHRLQSIKVVFCLTLSLYLAETTVSLVNEFVVGSVVLISRTTKPFFAKVAKSNIPISLPHFARCRSE